VGYFAGTLSAMIGIALLGEEYWYLERRLKKHYNFKNSVNVKLFT
jgi:hypothetical protein